MSDTPTIDDQIAAVRRAVSTREQQAQTSDFSRAGTDAKSLHDALATLEQHKLALAVVEAARQAVLQIRVHGTTYHRLTDAIAAFDARKETR
jgi:carbonic anhydrase